MSKIAIVCNSTNPDLVDYFKCKISILGIEVLILKNKAISLEDKRSFTSSVMSRAFIDKLLPIDFILSFYILVIILKNDIQVIHFTTAHISNIFLSTLLKPFKIKQIFTIHDLDPHPGKKSIFIKKYNEYVINFLADEIISFSRKEIAKQKQLHKFKYLPLSGFDLHINKPKIGNKNILFFGRMESYKGFNNLFDIISLANAQNIGYTFTIAGKGNIPNIDELSKLENVTIINRFIGENELNELFHKASFVLLPYDSATQSGVSILSYSYATPVIVYDVGALNEYVVEGTTGYVVPYRDNHEIINIVRHATDESIADLSQNVIKTFQEIYSKNSCKKLYTEYYLNLLGDSK